MNIYRGGGASLFAPTATTELEKIDPDTGYLDNDFITSNSTPTMWVKVTGTLQSGDTIGISFDAGLTFTDITANYDPVADMYFYVPPTPLLPDIPYQVTTAVFDKQNIVGNTAGQIITVLSDPTKTATIDTYYDNAGPNQGHFGSGIATDDRTIQLEGKVSAPLDTAKGEKLFLYEGSTRIGEITVDAQGNWTYDIPGILENNSVHTYHVVVENQAGGQGPASNYFDVDVKLAISVDFLTTEDTTPVLKGGIGFELLAGEYVEITVNGKTYSSDPLNPLNGPVVINQANNTWSVQIPGSDALPIGVYDIVAVLHKQDGTTVVADTTLNELTIEGQPIVIPGVGDDDEKATALTLGEDGQWKIFTNGAVLDQRATSETTFGNFEVTKLPSKDVSGFGPGMGSQNGTWIDINRDGLMDFIASDGVGTTGQQMFLNIGNNNYLSYQIGSQNRLGPDYNPKANVLSEFGGVIGFDKTGDGYVDIVYGDIRPGDSGSIYSRVGSSGKERTWDSQFVTNLNGTLQAMIKDSSYTQSHFGPGSMGTSSNWGNAQPGQELSGVDLNNDGTVDIVFHSNYSYNKIGGNGGLIYPDISEDPYRLVVASNKGQGGYETTQIIENVFQNGATEKDNVGNGISMTWADFDGDGYMDLFMGRGSSSTGGTYHSEYESRILFNDGHGNLASTAPNNVGDANNVHWMGDDLQGGPSLAVDWDGDGKMDIIELPGYGTGNGMTEPGNTGAINLYTNKTVNGQVAFDTTNLLGGSNTIGAWGSINNPSGTKADPVTGAVVADVDWDGAQDLIVFTSQGNTQTIHNTNTVADGTALHFRILDDQGVNSLFGNTVQLYNSTGQLVASRIINAQSGNQTNNSTGIVDFYGLDPNETYSVVLLRNVKGVSANVGGNGSGGVIANINDSWSGFKPGAANEAHVLTAESDTNIANANRGGIVGTGYNDTFYATKGTDIYDGAGGTDSNKKWSATGGRDVIDFKLAGDQSIYVDLTKTAYQNTGFNTVKLSNIEGVSGGNGNDTFIGNSDDNFFNGRGGNDTFNLGNGGHDTLAYELIDENDNTGGNGFDTVNGFTVGNVQTNNDADIIDLSGLLQGYSAGSDINDFLSVTYQGNNTILHVDIDGAGTQFSSTSLLTLTNVTVDIATLMMNQQIIV